MGSDEGLAAIVYLVMITVFYAPPTGTRSPIFTLCLIATRWFALMAFGPKASGPDQ